MNTIQQTFPVKDRLLDIQLKLPATFVGDEVEVTVRSVPANEVNAACKGMVDYLLRWDISDFSQQQREAYQTLLKFYQEEFRPRTLPPAGLWEHFIKMSDNFGEPMDDEDLWYQDIFEA